MFKKIIQVSMILVLCVIGIALSPNIHSVESNNEVVEKTMVDELLVSDITNTTVNHGTEITIKYSIKDEYNAIHDTTIEISSNGVYSKSVSSELISDVYTYTFRVLDLGESIITLQVSSSEYESTESIYVFSTETTDYISTVSLSSAKRYYFIDLYEQGLVTDLDYNFIVFGDDYEANIEVTPNYINSSLLYIRGYIKFEDQSGTDLPAQEVTIQIYDDDPIIGYNLLKTIKTNSTGYYTTTVTNDSSWLENGGLDIIVRVYFGNDDFHVEDFWTIYKFDFPKLDNVGDGTLIRQDVTFKDGTEKNDAMHIYQAGIVGFKYLRYLDNQVSYPFLRFVFPTFMGNTYYTPILHHIDLQVNRGHNWDTILHEFGHYVGDLYGLHDFWGAYHNFTMNLADTMGKDLGTMLAWAEGFGSYYSVVSQLRYATNYTSITEVGNNTYAGYNIESSSSNMLGEANEWVVARLLYDLMDDSPSETRDSISYGEIGLFNKIRDAVPFFPPILWNLSDFIQTLGIDESDESLGKLLSYYNIAAQPISPANNSTATFYRPTLTWDNYNGSTNHPNNQFTVYVKNSDGTTIFSQNVGNTTSYTLTTAQWQSILNSNAASIKWNVKAEQTDSPHTGPYFSETFVLNLPTVTTVYAGSSTPTLYIEGISYLHWFKFTAPSSGQYTFNTTGTTDTYGDVFNNIVAGESTTGRIAYDNDSGVDTNFSITMSLMNGQTIYIRVKGYYWETTGPFVFHVSPNPHVHSYTHHYVKYNNLKHRSYCSDGAYILENHDWIMIPYDDGVNQGLQQYCPDCGATGLIMLMSRGVVNHIIETEHSH